MIGGKRLCATALDTRVSAQIASTVSLALGLPPTRVQCLTVQEIFVLCQESESEVTTTVGDPPTGNTEMGFSAELTWAAWEIRGFGRWTGPQPLPSGSAG